MNKLSVLRSGLWAAVLVVAAIVAMFFFVRGDSPVAGAKSAYGSPFDLVDQNGAEFSRDDLNGKPSAVFFGYTHCPDVCPTTLFELAGYQKQVASQGGDFRIVFVTVDPARDTPQVLKSYVEAVGGDITALTGSPDEVAAMLEGWGIHARKTSDGPSYDMDHTSTTLLLDANGALAGTIGYGENVADANAKLEKLTGV